MGYHWHSEGYFLKLNKRTSFTCICVRPSEPYSERTAGCGTEVVWLTVWKENDHSTNSHLEQVRIYHLATAARILGSLGLSLQHFWPVSLPGRAASQQARPQWLAVGSGNHTEGVWSIALNPHSPQQHSDSSPALMALWHILNQDTRAGDWRPCSHICIVFTSWSRSLSDKLFKSLLLCFTIAQMWRSLSSTPKRIVLKYIIKACVGG